MSFTLYIANKTYSSWSFRPWLAMKVKEIPFREVLVPFDDDAGNPEFRTFSPTGKVPVLVRDALTVWESLAIIEYVADFFPEVGLWPAGIEERAVARAVSTEMATGFRALRSACPMNMRREPKALAVDAPVRTDVARIEALWTSLIERHGGPFLFGGTFCAADAMFAPVVNRLRVYRLTESAPVLAYMDTIGGLPAWQEWVDAAQEESWVVPADEV